jgi:cell division protein FtsB
MKLVKYLAALWIGVFVYVFLSFFWGAAGVSAYRQLETELDKETANIEALKIINKDLENTKNALLYDKDTLTVYAREHGYALPEERFVRVVGAGNVSRMPLFSGQIAAPVPPEYTPDRVIRIISFFAAVTVLICIGAYDFLKYIGTARE